MKYVHKSLRAPSQPVAVVAPPVVSPPAVVTVPVPVPKVPHELFDATWALVLGHRQFIRAGVPGCSCGVTFDSHATFVADHAQHLSDEVVTHVLKFLLKAVEREAADVAAVLSLLQSMLAEAPVLEGVPA